MLHTQLAALALAAAAVFASGCGSSKSESTTTVSATTPSTAATTTTAAAAVPPVSTKAVKISTGTPLTHARWVAEGDAICASTDAKLASLGAHTESELASELPQAAVYYTVESEELAKLVPPKSMAHDWAQIVDNLHLFSVYTDQAAQYIKTAHKVESPALAKAVQTQKKVLITARHDGFKRCSLAH
jgi:hypothetical protein